jgi:hypothetical protein
MPGLRRPATRWQQDGNDGGFCSFCAVNRRPPEAKEHSHEHATKAGDQGGSGGTGAIRLRHRRRHLSGTPVAHASVASARHAPGDNRFAELRALDQVKRAVAWAAVERAWGG